MRNSKRLEILPLPGRANLEGIPLNPETFSPFRHGDEIFFRSPESRSAPGYRVFYWDERHKRASSPASPANPRRRLAAASELRFSPFSSSYYFLYITEIFGAAGRKNKPELGILKHFPKQPENPPHGQRTNLSLLKQKSARA